MPNRPKTAPNNRLRSDENGVITRDDSLPLFSGGKLKLTVLKAEKYIGNSRIVFGKGGAHLSKIQVFSLDEKVGESVVNHGGVDEEFQWAGYEDDLRPMSITNSPIVRLVVFDCDRQHDRRPLGWALVSVMDIPGIGSDDYRVTTAIQTRSDVDSFDPKALSIVGSITLKIQYEPYKVASLEQFEDHNIDVTPMSAIRFGFGWSCSDTDTDVLSGKYTAALVMFDRNGRFIDAVDALHPRTKRGPRCLHRRVPDKSGDGFADAEAVQVQLVGSSAPRQSNVFAYFAVITALDPDASLSNLSGGMYMRLVNGNNNMENCRYSVAVDEPTSACIMARVVKDAEDPNKWVVKAYGQLAFSERSYGSLIPEMRDLLGDVVPNCKGGGKDIISYAYVDRWINLTPLLVADLTAEPAVLEPTEGEEGGESPAPAVPQDVTTISIGCNWTQLGDKPLQADLGCLLIDTERAVSDSVSAEKPRSSCGSVALVNIDIDEEGVDLATADDRAVQLSLAEVPENVSLLAFYILNANVGESLGGIGSINAHVFETESKRELVMLDCPLNVNLKSCPTLLLCLLTRREGQWHFVNTSKTSAGPDLLENGVYLEEYLSSSGILGKL